MTALQNGSIAEAMRRAGMNTEAARLRVAAESRLRKANRNAHVALASFVDDVRAGGGMLAALIEITDKQIREAALAYLQRVAADMTGKPGARDQITIGAQRTSASAPGTLRDGGGQLYSDTQPNNAAPPSHHNRDGAGHRARESHVHAARPAREPSPAMRKAMVAARANVVRSIFDRELGLGGIIVGHATKTDFINLRKKGLLVTAAADLFLTQIEWPDDDKTPLRQCATEKQVKNIFAAAYRSMDAMGITNVGA